MAEQVTALYFGKLPCRGDFVRSSSNPALIQSLDRWLSSGIELLAEDAHWKQIYDQAAPANFALISAHRNTAVAGHIVASADTSGRRFPFLTVATIDGFNGVDLMRLGPLMFEAAWQGLSVAAAQARAATELTESAILDDLSSLSVAAALPAAEANGQYNRFLEQTTLTGLVQELSDISVQIDVRQAIFALGLLLQPLMSSAGQPIDKGLCLPLPKDPVYRALVATFWMDLVSRFLSGTTYDLTLFIPSSGVGSKPCLLVAFSAGAASALQGLFDSRMTDSVFISLNESAWVESYIENDYALKKISSYLQQPDMSLAQILDSFQEAFLGG